MTVGERIKKLRIEKGLSQEELAKRAGYADKTAICKIERSGDDVSTYIINKMANALGVDSSKIYAWDLDITEEERILIADYRIADETTQEMVKRLLSYADRMKRGDEK